MPVSELVLFLLYLSPRKRATLFKFEILKSAEFGGFYGSKPLLAEGYPWWWFTGSKCCCSARHLALLAAAHLMPLGGVTFGGPVQAAQLMPLGPVVCVGCVRLSEVVWLLEQGLITL